MLFGLSVEEHGVHSTCPHCGSEVTYWQRQITGCPRCQAAAAPQATVGWGTLLTIGIVVSVFLRSDLQDLSSRLSGMRSSFDEFKKASDSQTNEIRDLRKAVEDTVNRCP